MNISNYNTSVLNQLNLLLENNGFTTYLLKSPREKFSFDILAKNEDFLIVLKIISNIDNLSEDLLEDMKFFSRIIQAIPILIGERNRRTKLDDNTIYVRRNLPIVNYNTFKSVIKDNVFPYILAKRGGGAIFLDGNRLRLMRDKKELSRKMFSEMIGITKRSLCSYEKGVMRTSVETAQKIQKILDDSVIRRINLYKWNFQVKLEEFLEQNVEKTEFDELIEGILKDIGFSTFWNKKNINPYDLFITSKDVKSFEDMDSFFPVCSSINEKTEKINKIKLENLYKISKILNKIYLHIVDNSFKIPTSFVSKLPIVRLKELEKIDDIERFKNFVKEWKN